MIMEINEQLTNFFCEIFYGMIQTLNTHDPTSNITPNEVYLLIFVGFFLQLFFLLSFN